MLRNISKENFPRLVDLAEKDFITIEQIQTLLTVSNYYIKNIIEFIEILNQKCSSDLFDILYENKDNEMLIHYDIYTKDKEKKVTTDKKMN